MINKPQELIGNITATQELNGDVNVATVMIPPSLQEKEVNPSVEQQNVLPDEGYNGLSKVVVNNVDSSIDSNIQSENIKDGISILGVTGNYVTPINLQNKELTTNGVYEADSGYDGLGEVTVNVDSVDIYDYFPFNPTITTSIYWYENIKKLPYFELVAQKSFTNVFNGFKGQYLDVSGIDTSNTTSVNGCFNYCTELLEIDVSMWDVSKVTNCNYLFSNCWKLQKIDVRNFNFPTISLRSNIFGATESSGVPASCLVIVKDATNKTWVQENYTWLTNVKTAAEYENQ